MILLTRLCHVSYIFIFYIFFLFKHKLMQTDYAKKWKRRKGFTKTNNSEYLTPYKQYGLVKYMESLYKVTDKALISFLQLKVNKAHGYHICIIICKNYHFFRCLGTTKNRLDVKYTNKIIITCKYLPNIRKNKVLLSCVGTQFTIWLM